MMTFVRSLVLVAVVGAFGACEKQPVSVIRSIEETMHHHKHDESHGEAKDAKDAKETPASSESH